MGTSDRSELSGGRAKLVVTNKRLQPGPEGATFELPLDSIEQTEGLFGIVGFAHLGRIGAPYVAPIGEQFALHAFMSAGYAIPNMAHACNNPPGEQLQRQVIEGASPRDVVMISEADLNVLTQLNRDAQRFGRSDGDAAVEWVRRNEIAGRLVVLVPGSSEVFGRNPASGFIRQLTEAASDPRQSAAIAAVSEYHCKIVLDDHSALHVVDLDARNGTSVSYAYDPASVAFEQ